MKPILALLIVLFVASVIITVVVLVLKRQHKSSDPCANAPAGPVGSPCHWTDQQKSDILSTLSFGQSLNTCILANLSAAYSYATASDPNFNPSEADMRPIMSPCIGQKGSWAPEFKTYLTSQITSQITVSVPSACIPCVINALEITYDPLDLMNLMNPPKGTTPTDPIGPVLKASCSSQCKPSENYCGSCRR